MKAMVDLNCDMGESFGMYKLGLDEEAVKYISSANVACGYHAGDPQVMAHTVKIAVASGVAVGAHPSFPDLMGFGRRQMDASPEEIRNYVIYQTGALAAFVQAGGARLQHVKPHGAMYNMAAADKKIARALAEAIYAVDKELIFLVLANSEMERASEEVGLRYAREVFADRNYNADGTLVARSNPQAVIKDSDLVAQRMIEIIKTGQIRAVDGSVFAVKADSVCLHGDTPGAIEHMKHLRRAILDAGIKITPMKEISHV